jgi:hypothetical protein
MWQLGNKKNKSQKMEDLLLKKRIDDFLKEYRELVLKHKVDFNPILVYDKKGIFPSVELIDVSGQDLENTKKDENK